MGESEVPHIRTSERRGLYARLHEAHEEEHGAKVTGTPWVASPFLRWGALGVAFISFSALLGYSAIPQDESNAAPALSFFALYLTDDPLPAGLDGLIVSLARAGAGDPSNAHSLDLRVRSFNLAQHHGVGDALPVATGYVLPSERDKVFIEFSAAIGLRGEEEVPLQLSERFLHVEYAAGEGLSDRSAVLLDIDLERSVQEVDQGQGRFLRFVPTVGEVYEEALPESIVAVPSGEPIPSMEPLFATATPMEPIRQYRTTTQPAKVDAADAGDAADDLGAKAPLGLGGNDDEAAEDEPTETSEAPPTSHPSPSTSSAGPTFTESPEATPVNHPPSAPQAPSPPSGTWVDGVPTLAWSGGQDPDPEEVTFEVYVSTTNPPPLLQPTCTTEERTCTPASLDEDTVYYWRVQVHDGAGGVTLGETWSFKTKAEHCVEVGLETCPIS